jgi:cell division protein FtsB
MTPEENKRLEQLLGQRGASVVYQDARVTRATNWLLAAIATGLLAGFWSMLASVNQVKEQNATLVAKMEFMQQQFRDLKDQNTAINAAQDARLSIYDDRLRTIEREVK